MISVNIFRPATLNAIINCATTPIVYTSALWHWLRKKTLIKVQDYLDSLPDDVLEINLSNKYLTELPDLSRFTQLQKLDCSWNKLTCLPPNLPNSLQELNCKHNQLTYLPETEKLPNSLKKIDCSYNKLTYLPDHIFDYLEHLRCYHNNIYIVSHLRCYHNNIYIVSQSLLPPHSDGNGVVW